MSYRKNASGVIERIADGMNIPEVGDNADWIEYQEWCEAGNKAEEYSPPPPQAVQIKAEAQRRIMTLMGAAEIVACLIKQSNANMRATKLTRKEMMGEELTPAEVAESAALEKLSEAIEHIRARSNELERSLPIDFADDHHWK